MDLKPLMQGLDTTPGSIYNLRQRLEIYQQMQDDFALGKIDQATENNTDEGFCWWLWCNQYFFPVVAEQFEEVYPELYEHRELKTIEGRFQDFHYTKKSNDYIGRLKRLEALGGAIQDVKKKIEKYQNKAK